MSHTQKYIFVSTVQYQVIYLSFILKNETD